MADEALQWHDGFHAALQIELQGESARLRFYSEHELYKKPLRIDTLVIMESDDTPIQKNIGKIFRKHNLIEYKSPDDYLSIDDFYKAYGYACLYQSNTDRVHSISMMDVSLTFVCSHYPKKMIKLLEQERGIYVEQREAGIYWLHNDPIPMQIILINQLSPDENRWLNSLRHNLEVNADTECIIRDYNMHKQSILYQAAMDLIMRANPKTMKEARVMVCDAFKEIFADEFQEHEEKLKAQEEKLKAQEKKFKVQEKKLKAQEKKLKAQEEKFKSQEEKFKSQEEKFKSQEEKFKSQEAKFKSQEEKFKSQAAEVQKNACKKTEKRFASLIQRLINNNLIDDIKRITEDEEYLAHMYEHYGL